MISGAFELVPTNVSAKPCYNAQEEKILAIDVGQQLDESRYYASALDIILRSQYLAEYAIRKNSLAKADLVIVPELHQREWFDFSDPSDAIDAGYVAACEKLFATKPMTTSKHIPKVATSKQPVPGKGLLAEMNKLDESTSLNPA